MADDGRVTLRVEHQGDDHRHLWAYVDEAGALHIDGQEVLGPSMAIGGSDGEYEWFKTIAADVPRVVALLGGASGDDVLDVLERDFTGTRSYDLEARLRASDIPIDLHTWSG